jgi:hypothetical protein
MSVRLSKVSRVSGRLNQIMDLPDEDILELGGKCLRRPSGDARAANRSAGARCRFLSVWFRCCHVYGRMHRNAEETAYEGRCPKCGRAVRARIGADGTRQRMFEAM